MIRSVTVAYRVTAFSGIPVCSVESLPLRWVKIGDLADLDIVETHRHIVDRLLDGSSLVLE